jgi:hypothetical protein
MTKTKTRKPNLATVTKHFPKKGERFIDGEWVVPVVEEVNETHPQASRAMETRNFYRKQANWPALRSK